MAAALCHSVTLNPSTVLGREAVVCEKTKSLPLGRYKLSATHYNGSLGSLNEYFGPYPFYSEIL